MKCEVCGSEFHRNIWGEDDERRNMCSIECADVYLCWGHRTKENETLYEFMKRIKLSD